MNKVIILLLAFALILGLSQCKKNVETISSVPVSVYITLDVDGGDKVIVDPHGNPSYATVTFEDGDVIYVGNNGAYCGYLTYDGTKFGGNIVPTSADDEDFLHFYFMGNKGPQSEPTSVDISDQTIKYPVISYGRSIQLYNSTNTKYSTTLYNKCAIMRFDVTGAGDNDVVTITGMNNTVTVDFSANSIGPAVNPYTYSKNGEGDIILHNEDNGERWAIVLPQAEVTDAIAYAMEITTSPTVKYVSTNAITVPAVSANGYYANGVTLTMTLPGLFSLADSIQVRFSSGNLQATYDGSSWSWDFAPNQWSYIGVAAANTRVLDTEPWINGTGTVDLFGWSTATTYYGINSSKEQSTYSGDFVDWGTNAIGSDTAGTWRTLTNAEWQYLFNYGSSPNATRTGKFATATVNGIAGMVLLPDIWVLPAGCTFHAGLNGLNLNNYDADAWAKMESNGAVFLPAAGLRNAAGVYDTNRTLGYYWSSTVDSGITAWRMYFYIQASNMGPQARERNRGLSVRLVR